MKRKQKILTKFIYWIKLIILLKKERNFMLSVVGMEKTYN